MIPLDLAQVLNGEMPVGWGQDGRELLAIHQAGLMGFAVQWLHLPAVTSLDTADLYLHHKVLPFSCRPSCLLPVPKASLPCV